MLYVTEVEAKLFDLIDLQHTSQLYYIGLVLKRSDNRYQYYIHLVSFTLYLELISSQHPTINAMQLAIHLLYSFLM